jgi:hypothetical protein
LSFSFCFILNVINSKTTTRQTGFLSTVTPIIASETGCAFPEVLGGEEKTVECVPGRTISNPSRLRTHHSNPITSPDALFQPHHVPGRAIPTRRVRPRPHRFWK